MTTKNHFLFVLALGFSTHTVAQTDEEYLGSSYDKGLDCMSRLQVGLNRIDKHCDSKMQDRLAQDRIKCRGMTDTIELMISHRFPGEQFPQSQVTCSMARQVAEAATPPCSFSWIQRLDGSYACYQPRLSSHCPIGDRIPEWAEPQADWNCCAQWYALESNLQRCEKVLPSVESTLSYCGAFLDSQSPVPGYFSIPGYEELLYTAYSRWQSRVVQIEHLRSIARIDEDAFVCYRRPFRPLVTPPTPPPARAPGTPIPWSSPG